MSVAEDELFAVACPACRATVAVGRGLSGEEAGCPLCGQPFIVPDPGPAPGSMSAPEPVASRPAAPPAQAPSAGPAAAQAPSARPAAPAAVKPPPERPRQPAGRAAGARAQTRSRRNLLIMLCGIGILVVLAALLSSRTGRRR